MKFLLEKLPGWILNLAVVVSCLWMFWIWIGWNQNIYLFYLIGLWTIIFPDPLRGIVLKNNLIKIIIVLINCIVIFVFK